MKRLVPAAALALALVGGHVASAANATLSLVPASGPAGQPFTATYSYTGGTCSGTATFTWDGRQVASKAVGKSGGRCTASVQITPPGTDNQPGPHTVGASSPNGGAAQSQTYQVNGKLPSPTPRPTATASASPSPKASPKPPTSTPNPTAGASPHPTPSPSPKSAPAARKNGPLSCRPSSAREGFATMLDASAQRQGSDVAVRGFRPPQMLPPDLGRSTLVQVQLLLPARQRAITGDETASCLLIGLGPATAYRYALYALHGVLVVSVVPAGPADLATIRYDTADWTYELVAATGAQPVSGSGSFGTKPGPDPGARLREAVIRGLIVVAFTLALLGLVAWWRMGRRRRPAAPPGPPPGAPPAGV